MDSGQDVSRKLKALGLVAAVAVVLIHSPAIGGVEHVVQWNTRVHTWLCAVMMDWAVPLFMLMSGYWFGRGGYVRCLDDETYGRFLQRKVCRVLIPYLLFAIVAFLISAPIFAVNNMMKGEPLVSRMFFDGQNALGAVNRLFGLVGLEAPHHNKSLWYLRTLFILFVFAPLWKLLLRRFRLALIFLTIPFLINPYSYWAAGVELRIGALSIFPLGVYLSTGDLRRFSISSRSAFFGLVVLWVLLSFGTLRFHGLLAFHILIGLLVIWNAYDRLPGAWQDGLCSLGRFSFWIYCLHFPLALTFRALWHSAIGKSDALLLIGTPCIWLLTFAISLACGWIVSRYCPRVYAFLLGERRERHE